MSAIQIVCTNCGAKYKLPATFQGDKAKCKACGSVIDVAAQRDGGGGGEQAAESAPAAARPAKAKPAKARPATAKADKPKRAGKGDDSGSGSSRRGSSGGSRRSRGGDAEESGGGRRGRRGGAGAESSGGGGGGGNKNGLIFGGIGLVAIVIVAVVFLMGGDDADQPTEQQAAKAGTGAEAATPAGDAAANASNADATKADDPKAADASGTAGDGGDDAGADEAAATKEPEPKPKPKPKPKSGKRELKTTDDVYKPKDESEPLDWPEYMSEEDIETVKGLVQDVVDGGITGVRAKTTLKEMGHKSLVGIINQLRLLDYTDSDDAATAGEFNKLLEEMTYGLNLGFRYSDFGAEIPLEDADWNARGSVKWQGLVTTSAPTPEKWDAFIKDRKKKMK